MEYWEHRSIHKNDTEHNDTQKNNKQKNDTF